MRPTVSDTPPVLVVRKYTDPLYVFDMDSVCVRGGDGVRGGVKEGVREGVKEEEGEGEYASVREDEGEGEGE